MVLDGWFQLDTRPFKQSLLNTIKRWSLMFKQHLMEHVTNRSEVRLRLNTYVYLIDYFLPSHSLNDLEEFITVSTQGMTGSVEEGDYQGLVDVMARLLAVKDKQAVADTMLEPLTQTIELLKSYQQELPDAVHLQLQVSNIRTYVCSFSTSFLHNIVPCGTKIGICTCVYVSTAGVARAMEQCEKDGSIG